MLISIPYNREAAAAYAERWALSRNPDMLTLTTWEGTALTSFRNAFMQAAV